MSTTANRRYPSQFEGPSLIPWWGALSAPDFTLKFVAPRHYVILNQDQEVVHHIFNNRAAARGELDAFVCKMRKVNKLLLGR